MTNQAKQQMHERLSYSLAKQVPDMLQRGMRIETSYGELELDEDDSAKVAALVKKLLERKLDRIGGAQ